MVQQTPGQPAKRPATLAEVAEAAGVSTATVSRVLNGNGKERSAGAIERADRVRQAARELGYRPDWRAQALRAGKTNAIGIVYSQSRPLIDMTAYDRLFRALAEVVHPAGYHLMFVHVPPSEGSPPASMLQAVDAAVFYHTIGRGEKEAAGHLRGPSILLNCEPRLPYPRVCPDDVGGASALARHLLELGHRRVLYLDIDGAGDEFDHFSRPVRRQTVTKTLCDGGGAVEVWRSPVAGEYDALVSRYLAMPAEDRPTGLVCIHSVHAICMLNAFTRRGVRVPDQLSIATFDDYPLVAEALVPLTTVAVPMEDLGRVGGGILLGALGGQAQHASDSTVLSERLVVRASTAKPPTPRSRRANN